jgi:hypothetical protein
LSLLDRSIRLARDHGGFGLNCTAEGLSLAGAPLLRKTVTGFAPRPSEDITALLKAAYGPVAGPADLAAGLSVVADALSRGDLGRAMIAALHMKLPELDWRAAANVALAEEALAKANFNPAEPRDERGRWTSSGATASSTGASNASPPTPDNRPVHIVGARIIPAQNFTGFGSNGPPPEPEDIPETTPDFGVPGRPVVGEFPAENLGGLGYGPARRPLPDGSPWQVVTPDIVRTLLASGRSGTPTMEVFVPRDGVGPILTGSTATDDLVKPEGYDGVRFYGTPQITTSRGVETAHAEESANEALRPAGTNQFSAIYFNISISRATGRLVESLIRPDVFAAVRPGLNTGYLYHPSEILSPGQTPEKMQERMPDVPGIAPVEARSYKAGGLIISKCFRDLGWWRNGVRYL